MSLINDALRRKGQEKKETTPEKSDGSPMEPVHPVSRDKVSYLGPILMVLIVFVLFLAGLLFWKGLQTKKELGATSPKQDQTFLRGDHTDANTKTTVQPGIIVTQIVAATPTQTLTEIAPTNLAATNSSAATNPPIALAPPGPPPLKLQGIFYRPSNPTAMINGKTVAIGELVSGARVLKIERQEVSVERNGKQEVLTLE